MPVPEKLDDDQEPVQSEFVRTALARMRAVPPLGRTPEYWAESKKLEGDLPIISGDPEGRLFDDDE